MLLRTRGGEREEERGGGEEEERRGGVGLGRGVWFCEENGREKKEKGGLGVGLVQCGWIWVWVVGWVSG